MTKYRASSDRYLKRFQATLAEARNLDAALLTSLETIQAGLKGGQINLSDQRGDLLSAKILIDKALHLNESATGNLSAAMHHLFENVEGMKAEQVFDNLTDIATMIINEKARMEFDPGLATAALVLTPQQVLVQSIIALPEMDMDKLVQALTEAQAKNSTEVSEKEKQND